MEYQLTNSDLQKLLEIGKDKIINDFGNILAFNFNDENSDATKAYIEDIFHTLEMEIDNK